MKSPAGAHQWRPKNGAGADKRGIADATREPFNADERIGGVQRHFDQAKPCLHQDVSGRVYLIGTNAAQDGDERKLRKRAGKVDHDLVSQMRVMPAMKAAWLSTMTACPPTAAIAAL